MDSTQNILINFQSDGDGLQPGIDGLNTLAVKDKALQDQSAATMAAVDARNKSIVAGTATAVTSTGKLADSFTNLNKSLAGGAFASTMKDISSATKDAQASVAAVKTGVDSFGVSLDVVSGKTKTLRGQLIQAKQSLADVIATTGTSGAAFDLAKNKVGLLENELIHLNQITKVVGSDTPGLKGLIGLASAITGGFSVASGAAAIFGSDDKDLQEALLKVQGALAILNGLTALQEQLEGSSAAAILVKTLFTKAETVATTENTAATVEQTAAVEGQAVATESAAGAAETLAGAETEVAVATKLALGPIALLLTALGAIAAVYINIKENEKAANDEAQKFFLASGELLDQTFKDFDNTNKEIIAGYNLQGASQQKLMDQNLLITRLKLENDQKQLASALALSTNTIEYDRLSDENKKTLAEKELQLANDVASGIADVQVQTLAIQRKNYEDDLKSYTAYQDAKVAEAAKGSIAELEAQINAINAKTADAVNLRLNPDITPGEIANINAQAQKQIIDLDNQILLIQLNNQKALYQAHLDSVQKGSVAELQAAQQVADQEYKIQLNTLGKTAEQRDEIRAKQAEEDESFQRQIAARAATLAEDLSKARLATAAKGSADAFAANLQIIGEEQTVALNAEGVTAEKKLEIQAEYQQKVDVLYQQEQEKQLSDQVKFLSAGLQAFGLNESQKLQLTLQRIEAQRQLELSQAQTSPATDTTPATTDPAAAAEINAKYDQEILTNKLATNKAILDSNIATANAFSANFIAANKEVIASDLTTANAKVAALKNIQDQDNLIYSLQTAALKKNLSDGLITQEDYNLQNQLLLNAHQAQTQTSSDAETKIIEDGIAKRQAAQQKYIEDIISIYQQGVDATLGTSATATALDQLTSLSGKVIALYQQNADAIAKIKASSMTQDQKNAAIQVQNTKTQLAGEVAVVQAAQALINQVFADASAQRQQDLANEIQSLEDSKAKELSVNNLTQQQIADVNARYAAKEAIIKRQAFEADKTAKKEQAIINGALAVTLAFATYAYPYNLIVAGLTAALVAIEVNDINQSQPPAFKDGVVDLQGPGTGTSDSISARLSKGESVIKASETKKYKAALVAMNNGKFEQYLAESDFLKPNLFKDFTYPTAPDHAKTSPNKALDYDKLGDSLANKIASKLPEAVHLHNVLDKDGLHTFVVRGKNKTEYKNVRYSMKGGRGK